MLLLERNGVGVLLPSVRCAMENACVALSGLQFHSGCTLSDSSNRRRTKVKGYAHIAIELRSPKYTGTKR